MYNAANKYLIAITATAALLTACGEKESTRQAKSLLAEAQAAISAGNYADATALIDSVSNAFPEEIDVRRDAMKLRPAATEGLTMAQLAQADSLTAVAQSRYDSIASLMLKIDNPELVEGYWVASQGRNPQPLSCDGIEGRVSLDGNFYLISSLNPSNIHHHSLTISTDVGDCAHTASVPYDGELNYRINGGEVVTYLADGCKELGAFAAAHRGQRLTVTFHGDKDKKIKLSQAQAAGLATSWDFAKAFNDFRHWSIERERLNRQLAIARDQKARLATDAPADAR